MAKFIISAFADEVSKNLDEQIAALKALGISHIEPRNVDGKNIADLTEEEAKDLRARLDAAGIGISSIGSPLGKVDITGDLDAHMEQVKNCVKVAQILGAKYIRMFSFFVPEGEEDKYEDKVFEGMARMLEIARGSGVQLLHENEKAIYGATVEHCVKLMEKFSPELGFIFDPSNFVQCAQDTIDGFKKLSPYIVYMHMKDSVYADNGEAAHRDMGFHKPANSHRPVGQGDGNVSWIIDQLIASDYQSFLTLEPHLAFGPDDDHLEKFNTAAHALIDMLESKGQKWE